MTQFEVIDERQKCYLMSKPNQPGNDAYDNPRLQWGVQIPLRDGVHLNATLYLPSVDTPPSPAIFTLTPYIAQRFHDDAVHLSRRGYSFLTVDCRGRGNSEGSFRPLFNECYDGYDVVEWLANQPYCNGNVAMWGGSYSGYNQWATAAKYPPHLKSIVPAAAIFVGVDFPMRSNIAWPYLLQWLMLVSGHASQQKIFDDQPYWNSQFARWFESGMAFREIDRLFGNPSEIFQEWTAHPTQCAYWDDANPTRAEYANLSIPILTITGIYDNAQSGALTHHRKHTENASAAACARNYLVIGPWDHAGTRMPQQIFAGVNFGIESLLDLRELHLQWYAWTMSDGPKPAFLKKNVAYYVTGAERWRYADTLNETTAGLQTLYLDSTGDATQIFGGGVLGTMPAHAGIDRYVHDPSGPGASASEAVSMQPQCLRPAFPIEDLTDQTMIYANEGKLLIYHSDPFECDLEITGFLRLRVWIALDAPDTDFLASVYAIDNCGTSILLSSDTLRARHRKTLREEELIQTTAPLRYDFERFTFVSRRMHRGSRLRLVLGPIHSIHSQKNYNNGRPVSDQTIQDTRVVTVSLHHDRERPSALYVPLGQLDTCENTSGGS